jgi:hypothetical protein
MQSKANIVFYCLDAWLVGSDPPQGIDSLLLVSYCIYQTGRFTDLMILWKRKMEVAWASAEGDSQTSSFMDFFGGWVRIEKIEIYQMLVSKLELFWEFILT